jgi:hypothetical protein
MGGLRGDLIDDLLTSDELMGRFATTLAACVALMESVDFSDGCCCCGEDMKNHSSPYSCSHMPTDMGDYYASITIEDAKKLLKEYEEKRIRR